MTTEQDVNLTGEGATARAADQPAVDPGAVQEQLERIFASHVFLHSKRSSTLLRFIVLATVEGRYDSLKERVIGMEVFGRTADYDTSLDASVRVAIAEVRRRLASYYREPAHEHELRIELPVRSYTAKFQWPVTVEPLEPIQDLPWVPPVVSPWTLRRVALSVCGALALLIGCVFLYRAVTPPPALDRFWAPMVKSTGPVWIVIGDRHPAFTPLPPPPAPDSHVPMSQFLRDQPTYPIMDVAAASGITTLLGRRGKDYEMSVARSIQLADLRGKTVVFLGTFLSEWPVSLGDNLRYQFRTTSPDGLNWIEDAKAPASRQWTVNLLAPYDQIPSDYALVNRVLDPKTGQWWIGITGLTGIGTLSAQEFLSDPDAMTALISRLPKNWEQKNLQLILQVPLVKASPGNPQVIQIDSW